MEKIAVNEKLVEQGSPPPEEEEEGLPPLIRRDITLTESVSPERRVARPLELRQILLPDNSLCLYYPIKKFNTNVEMYWRPFNPDIPPSTERLRIRKIATQGRPSR